MRFEFATATRIIFGEGTVREAAPLAREILAGAGSARVLVACGRNPARARPLLDALGAAGCDAETFCVTGEPTVAMITAAVGEARAQDCNLVIGFGGGSAIDAGKAIAALATNTADPLEYLEVIGRGRPLEQPPLPYVAIPTTAGTGAEVTRNAVLASPEHQVKVSLRSPLMLPRLAIVDPELTYELPGDVTASTGMDALTQLIEAFVSCRANPMTDAVCREGMTRAARSLDRAYRDGSDAAARADMAIASLFGGLALANAALGAVHGFAGPIGGMFPAPHGAVCAALLPHVMQANVRALRERDPRSPALGRYNEVARILTGSPSARAEDAVGFARGLIDELHISKLRAYGLSAEHISSVVEKARAASSMKGNPVALTPNELAGALTAAI